MSSTMKWVKPEMWIFIPLPNSCERYRWALLRLPVQGTSTAVMSLNTNICRYMNQLQSSSNVSLFQALGYYYSTIGFYVNHLILYLSVWFALVSQLILILVQKVLLGDEISNFITTRIFAFQVGFALMAPGLMQLWLEKGFFAGTWAYISHFCILAVYSTFHILNISSYWQYGLTKSAFYLASGRGTGLEHYSMKEMYDSFYKTHWRAGYIIFWMGLLALILGGSVFVFLVMYLLPGLNRFCDCELIVSVQLECGCGAPCF